MSTATHDTIVFPQRDSQAIVELAWSPTLVELLVRDPVAVLARIDAHDRLDASALAALVRQLLAIVLFASAVSGGIVGTYRGGIQILFSAIKTPAATLLTLVLCAPVFLAVGRAFELTRGARGTLVVALAAGARFALVRALLAPLVWLLFGVGGYHDAVLVVTFATALGGLTALDVLIRSLAPDGPRGVLAGALCVKVFAVIGGHATWLLRPYVVRPTTASVPFVRHLEGDLVEALDTTATSALGHYRHVTAPDSRTGVR